MDERLINLYEQELRHLRETSVEFGKAFPQRASELALGANPPDPYVERLLEGVAFLAARVRLKLDAQFPQFTQSLLETIYPDFLAPLPSLAVAQLNPDKRNPPPPTGFLIKRGDTIKGEPRRADALTQKFGGPTPCAFALAQQVLLLPIELVEANLLIRRLHETDAYQQFGARAALRLRIRNMSPAPWSQIPLDPLVIYAPERDGLGSQILETIFREQLGISAGIGGASGSILARPGPWARKVGFDENSAVLPRSPGTFDGHRFLREYFAMPERFLFFELRGFGPALKDCTSNILELVIPLRDAPASLEQALNVSSLKLFCAPAINLFSKHFNQQIEPGRFAEFHVIPDVNRAMDFEVQSLGDVIGYSSSSPQGRRFLPFFQSRYRDRSGAAFYTTNRQARLLSQEERLAGIPYSGSELFISLVDNNQAPFADGLQELAFTAKCTNRHLPIFLRDGNGVWSLSGAARAEIEILVGPTIPSFRPVDGDHAWRLLNLFSLNYISLADSQDNGNGVSANGQDKSAPGGPDKRVPPLRQLLSLYVEEGAEWAGHQINSLRRVLASPVVRPLYADSGPDQPRLILSIIRGLEVALEFDQAASQDSRLFLLGSVLDEFFARYVALNSFTETVVRTWPDAKERMRWPSRAGIRPLV